jgi:hypothetical protein
MSQAQWLQASKIPKKLYADKQIFVLLKTLMHGQLNE